ncbi:hypothetical protein [Nitrospira sp. Nam74]
MHRGMVQRFGRGVALGVVLILLSLLPFVSALEIHHAFAAADSDGHQHSEFDLCQWVQHHTGTSVLSVAPPVHAFVAFAPYQGRIPAPLLSVRLIRVGPSRAPPIS